MRSHGEIIRWNRDKGFGFVRDAAGTQDVFIHIKAFKNKSRQPAVGDRISYKITLNKQTKLRAVAVRFQGDGIFPNGIVFKRGAVAAVVLPAYALVLAMLVYKSLLPLYVPVAVVLLSLMTYWAYKSDKRAAQQGLWRVPEGRLHVLSLLGGWPGALAAQAILRHKSSKPSFQAFFFLTVLLNLAALSYLFIPQARAFLSPLARKMLRL
jgi:uncharacterized membrane protein YsdA (DUF1294 family)/cold shock CspA family protein